MAEPSSIETSMHFLSPSPTYTQEKPYSLRYPPPRNLAQSNVLRERHSIRLANMRGNPSLVLEQCGFELLPFPSPLSYEDFAEPLNITAKFLPQLGAEIKQLLGAHHVVPIDFSVRRRHRKFPVSTGENYEHDQPTAMAHIDFTVQEGERMLRIMFGDRAEDIISHPWKVVNAWRPLRGPLNDWPLGLCDARSVDYAADTMPADIVYREWATENLQIHYNPRHKWYFLPDQTTDEVLLFKSAESCPESPQAVPHGSFCNPKTDKDEPPRESIDCRFFVLFTERYLTSIDSIILVPGVGTAPCDSWFINNPSWVTFFKELSVEVTIHAYDHGIPLDDQFEWHRLLDAGGEFLARLHSFHLAQTTALGEPQPLLFICHGLGGSILKQALCIAGMHYERYSELLNSIAAIVFLSTPHRLEGVSTEQFGERLLAILKLDTGSQLSRLSLQQLKDHASSISDLAYRFNKTNLRVDMLSVYETKVTKIKSSHIKRAKRIIVVDKSLCCIGTETEKVLGADMSHLELVTMLGEANQFVQSLQTWLEGWINGARKHIQSKLYPEPGWQRSRMNSESSIISMTIESGSKVQRVEEQPSDFQRSPNDMVRWDTNSSTYVNVGSATPDLQTLLDNCSLQQADPRIPCFMVETFVRNKDFFGRQNLLEDLDDCLLPSKDLLVSSQPDRFRVGALCGLGGMGKTETAIEYAFTRRDAFDAIFWVHAEDESSIETGIAKIAVRLGIQDPNDPGNKVINKSLAIEWLCKPWKVDYNSDTPSRNKASWLVIFDNADNPEVLHPYSDITGSGAVLITSRSPRARSSFGQPAINFDIQPFSDEESGLLIQRIAGNKGHLDEAIEVGRRLGGLPLAIAQMAGMIGIEFLSYSEFLATYDDKEEESELHENVLQPLRKTARGNLSTVWALDKLSAQARAVLELASFLSPDCIQQTVLWKNAALADVPSYPRKFTHFRTARAQLIGSSLFRHNKETCWMHRVTQDVVRARMEPEHRLETFMHAVEVIAGTWPAQAIGGHDVSLWDTSEAMYRHVISLKDAYLKYFSDEPFIGHARLAALLTRAAWYQHERGESHILLPLLNLALKLCTLPDKDDDSDLESDIRYTLGAVANETNDAATCMEHTKKFLDIRLEIAQQTGRIDERLARGHNQMGISWMMTGDYRKGEESFFTSARLYEQLPDYTKDMRSLALVNLGLAYWLQGKLREADEVLVLGLTDREKLFGVLDSRNFRTGRFLHALGNVRFSQGKIEESEDFHRKALKQYQSTIRNHHHRTADVCHKLAQHCLRGELFDEGMEFIEQALKVWNVDREKTKDETSMRGMRGTAQAYASRVRAYSDATCAQSLYPSESFRGLGDFLWQPFISRPTFTSHPSVEAECRGLAAPFVSLYQYHHRESTFGQLQFANIDEFQELGDSVFPEKDSFALLLLQGYPSPDWINILGARFNIEPEFFQRHLSLSPDMRHPTARLIPSYNSNMASLPITTIGFGQCDGSLAGGHDQGNLEKLRRTESARMRDYTSKLASLSSPSLVPGDPIVRDYHVHSSGYFSLRQNVSLHFHPLKHGRGWIGIIWDDGNSEGCGFLKGPWMNGGMQENSWRVKLLSAAIYKPGTTAISQEMKGRANLTRVSSMSRMELILSNYDKKVDLRRASQNPFYALSPFFEPSLSTETRVLDIIDAEIQEELKHSRLIGDDEPTLSNLLYNQQVLKRQIRELRGLVCFMEALDKHPWTGECTAPQVSDPDNGTITAMLGDYRAILTHAQSLVEDCNQGMTVVAHNATIQESRKAIYEARGVTKLTRLAFIFIPASFVTAVFSMSVKELNENDGPPIWTWVVVVCIVWHQVKGTNHGFLKGQEVIMDGNAQGHSLNVVTQTPATDKGKRV
ncbi:hypothetical protein NM208_g4656 [Fusarium decemcellulare]|uniref:Uncharacterized protein n=1 Tax=Fusarium decemcellulare TaxID=57161 RepID=A0ACC1SJW1_9HYPO|nr:hypothetical protein NM208_g4656 [Fusarium decemcellulare]